MSLLLLAALLAAGSVLPAPARAGVKELNATVRSQGITGTEEGREAPASGTDPASARVSTPPAAADAEPVRKLDRKIAARQPLSRAELLGWIQAIERANPGKSWRDIITKIHHVSSPHTSGQSYIGVDFFKDGEENAGAKDVDILVSQPPLFLKEPGGKLVKLDHAWAGLRAMLNRNRVTAWSMGNVNTGWGDSFQVFMERLGSGWGWVAGKVTGNDERAERSAKEFAGAKGYKSPDQVRGNALGMRLQSFFRENPDAPLSQGFSELLEAGVAQRI